MWTVANLSPPIANGGFEAQLFESPQPLRSGSLAADAASDAELLLSEQAVNVSNSSAAVVIKPNAGVLFAKRIIRVSMVCVRCLIVLCRVGITDFTSKPPIWICRNAARRADSGRVS